MGTKPEVDLVLAQEPEADEDVIDVLRQRDVHRKVQEALETLAVLHENGRSMRTLYHRSLVILASRYAGSRDIANAMTMLALVPADFLSTDLPRLMVVDAMLTDCAVRLANFLVEGGLVEPTFVHRPAAEILPDVGEA